MNTLIGHINKIDEFEGLTLIEIQVENDILKSIVINNDSLTYQINDKVELLFKETEVILGQKTDHLISLQNKLNCTIINIQKGKLLSQVHLQYRNFKLCSIITTNSVINLDLKINDNIVAYIKTNEIMVAKC